MTKESEQRFEFKLLLLAFTLLLEASESVERKFEEATEVYPQFEPVREEVQNAHRHLLSALESLELALSDNK
jgi:hypothetical protein